MIGFGVWLLYIILDWRYGVVFTLFSSVRLMKSKCAGWHDGHGHDLPIARLYREVDTNDPDRENEEGTTFTLATLLPSTSTNDIIDGRQGSDCD